MEQNRNAAAIIRENLQYTHLAEQADVMNCTALSAISMLQGREKFHVVFMDPPYSKDLEKEVLRAATFKEILEDKALVIVEADLETHLSEEDMVGYRLLKEKIYKTNKHIFLEKL